MNGFYWKLIHDIIMSSKKDEIQENVFVFKRIVETYPCPKCTKHFEEYIKTNPLNTIKTKNDFINFVMKYKRDTKLNENENEHKIKRVQKNKFTY